MFVQDQIPSWCPSVRRYVKLEPPYQLRVDVPEETGYNSRRTSSRVHFEEDNCALGKPQERRCFRNRYDLIRSVV